MRRQPEFPGKHGATPSATRPRLIPLGCLVRRPRTGGWYWKGKPPGETKPRWIPLVPLGKRWATTSQPLAVAVANAMLRRWFGEVPEARSIRALLQDFRETVTAESSPGNAQAMTVQVGRFLDAAGVRQVWEIVPQTVQEYLAGLLRVCAPGTVHRHRAALSRFCRFCGLRGLLESNPVQFVRAPRLYHPPPRFLTDEQVAGLLAKARAVAPELVGPILAGLCGLRLGEIQALRWRDVQEGRLVIGADRPTKTYRWRVVPVSAELAEWLDQHTGKPDEPMFPAWADKMTWVHKMSRLTKDLPVFGELPGRRVGNQWHLLRSTAAVRGARAGRTVWDLMQAFGWTNPSTCMRYVSLAAVVSQGPVSPSLPAVAP